MCSKISCPVLLLPGSNDQEELKPGGELAEMFVSKGGRSNLFKNQLHGWMSRGDVNDDNVREGVEDGMSMILKFFEEHA